MKAREVEAILARAEFVLERQGDHRLWCKEGQCIPVPNHPRDLKIGTLRSIIKGTGLTVAGFLDLRR